MEILLITGLSITDVIDNNRKIMFYVDHKTPFALPAHFEIMSLIDSFHKKIDHISNHTQ